MENSNNSGSSMDVDRSTSSKRRRSPEVGEEAHSIDSTKKMKSKGKKMAGGNPRTACLNFKENIPYNFYTGEDFYGRINICSRSAYLFEIRQKLSEEAWERLKQGPFGKVLEMIQHVMFSPQTIHAVLMKQLKCGKKFETWYDVCGKEARFSMQEFSLITGLNCGLGRSRQGRGEKRAMTEFFGKPTISVHELFERFIQYKQQDYHKTQLAMLLIVEGLLLGGDKKRLINPYHVKLLETKEGFYEYPWGRVAYLELHKSLTTSLSRRMVTSQKAKEVQSERRIPYTLQGLPLVFQVWIWEAAQSVGHQYAHRYEGDRYPRGIRWYLDEAPERGVLEQSFADTEVVVKPVLIPECEGERQLLIGCFFDEEVNNEEDHFDKVVKKAIDGTDDRILLLDGNDHDGKDNSSAHPSKVPAQKATAKAPKKVASKEVASKKMATKKEPKKEPKKDPKKEPKKVAPKKVALNKKQPKEKSVKKKAPKRKERKYLDFEEKSAGEEESDEEDEEEVGYEEFVDEDDNKEKKKQKLKRRKTEEEAIKAEEEGEAEDEEEDEEEDDGEGDGGDDGDDDKGEGGATAGGTEEDADNEKKSKEEQPPPENNDADNEKKEEDHPPQDNKDEDIGEVDTTLLVTVFEDLGKSQAVPVVIEHYQQAVDSVGVVVKDILGAFSPKEEGEGCHRAETTDCHDAPSVELTQEAPKDGDVKRYPLRNTISTIKEPFTDEKASKLLKKITKNRACTELSQLMRWYSEKSGAPILSSTNMIPFKGDSKFKMEHDTFAKILEPRTWLGNMEIDEALYFIGECVKQKASDKHKCVVLDCIWSRCIVQLYTSKLGNEKETTSDAANAMGRLLQYCSGERPEFYGRKWDDIDYIYAPFFVSGNHWVSLEVDLREWELHVFDCNVDLNEDTELLSQLVPLLHVLPLVLQENPATSQKYAQQRGKSLQFKRFRKIKQNKKGGDCGVYTIKYIEWLSNGLTNLDALCDKYVDAHRRDIAESIFNKKWVSLLRE